MDLTSIKKIASKINISIIVISKEFCSLFLKYHLLLHYSQSCHCLKCKVQQQFVSYIFAVV